MADAQANDGIAEGCRAKRLDSVRVRSKKLRRFRILDGSEEAKPETVANRLISVKDIASVFVRGRGDGLLVDVRFFEGREPDNVVSYVTKRFRDQLGRVVRY
jgi:hypothetical protein